MHGYLATLQPTEKMRAPLLRGHVPKASRLARGNPPTHAGIRDEHGVIVVVVINAIERDRVVFRGNNDIPDSFRSFALGPFDDGGVMPVWLFDLAH